MALSIDLITGLLSFVITLLILSYAIGDNPLFRVATYVFVGISAGYLGAVAWWQVLWPSLLRPLAFGSISERADLAVPLLGAGLILLRIVPGFGRLGSPAIAYLVGVTAAVAIFGAVTGTLFPQFLAIVNAWDLEAAAARGAGLLGVVWNGGFILVGTVTTLAYFHFGARPAADGSLSRSALVEMPAFVGRIFIATTLGVIFAGVYASALTALVERLASIFRFLASI